MKHNINLEIDNKLLDKQVTSLLLVRYHPNTVKQFDKEILDHIDGLINFIEAVQDSMDEPEDDCAFKILNTHAEYVEAQSKNNR